MSASSLGGGPFESPTSGHYPRSYYLELGIDYGTSTIKVAGRLRYEGDGQPMKAIPFLFNDGQDEEIPACVALVNGEFVCGFRLRDRMDHDDAQSRVPRHLHFTCVKLLLMDRYRKEDADSLWSDATKLQGRPVEDFIAAQIKDVIEEVRKHIGTTAFKTHLSDSDLQELDIRARFSVPEEWTPEACQKMQDAAQAAGIVMSEIASEPQCTVAQLMDRVTEHADLGETLKPGDHIAVLDTGCGTTDGVSYRVGGGSNSRMQLDMVDESSGILCGSQMVNRNIISKLDQQHNLSKVAQGLGIHLQDLRYQLNYQVEKLKKEFPPGNTATITIEGENQVSHHFRLSREDVDRAHDGPVEEIVKLFKRLIKKKIPKFLLIAGGFKKSKHLTPRLKKICEELGIGVITCATNPEATCVAEGLLSSRYDKIEVKYLPSRYGYALLQDAVTNRVKHPDLHHQSGGHAGLPKATQVQPSPWDERFPYAPDRLRILLNKGQSSTFAEPLVTEYRVSCKKPALEDTFVYLDRSFNDNEPALAPTTDVKSPSRGFRKGVHTWRTYRIQFTPAELGPAPIVESANGEKCYFLPATINLSYDDTKNIKITYIFDVGQVVKLVTEGNVWQSSFSEFCPEARTDLTDLDATEDDDYAGVQFLSKQEQEEAIAEAQADGVNLEPSYKEMEREDEEAEKDEAMPDGHVVVVDDDSDDEDYMD